MAELDRIEQNETDITQVQAAFAARESIWDIMTQITNREMALKEKTHRKETPAEREKRHREVLSYPEKSCACGHYHGEQGCEHHHAHKECECHHHDKENCCHGGKTCSEM